MDMLARSVVWITGSTILSQSLAMLSVPVLSRLYSPEDLGTLAIFTAFVTTAAVVVSLRYELAIPLPEDPRHSVHLLNLVFFCSFAGSIIIALLVLFFPKLFSFYLGPQINVWILWLLPISVFVTALNQGLYFYALKHQLLKGIAISKLVQSVVLIVTQIGGFFLIENALIVGYIISQIAQVTLISYWTRMPSLIRLPCADTRAVAMRYRQFPQFYLWSGLISGINLQIPLLLITHYFGVKIAGYYAVAYRILNALPSLVGQSIGHAYLSTAIRERDHLPEITQRLYTRQVEMIMPFVLFCGILGPEISLILLGSGWQETGIMIQWLIPLVFLSFVVNPFTEIFTLYEKQCFSTLFQSLLFIQRFASIALVAALGGDEYSAVGCFSISGTLLWLGLLLLLLHVCGLPVRTVFLPGKRMGWWISMTVVMVFFKYSGSKISSLMFLILMTLITILYLYNTVWSALYTSLQTNGGRRYN